MAFTKPLPLPNHHRELASEHAFMPEDKLSVNTKLISPLTPGKYQQFFNLSPISPSSVMLQGRSIKELATLPNSETTHGNAEAFRSQDADMLTTTDLPSPSFFNIDTENEPTPLLNQEITSLETWLYDNNLISPTHLSTQQIMDNDFYANLPDPVFDTHVFGKPPTPIVASFADLEIDPLRRYDQQQHNTVQTQPMSWKQGQFGMTQRQFDDSQLQSSYPEPGQASQQQPYYTQQATSQPVAHACNLPYQPPQTASQVRPLTPTPSANAPTRPSKRKAEDTTTTIDNTQTSYPAERPFKSAAHPHVRVNGTTKGLTTRTGKINHYSATKDGGYQSLPQLAPWTDARTGLMFSYNVFGELFSPQAQAEFMANPSSSNKKPKITFTPEQLTSYLTSLNRPNKTTLFIQRTPADSARRYPTTTSATCRFAHCPAHGKIGVGCYRVAIDERWSEHGTTTDPFIVAGYVHLYCLERFCDLRELVNLEESGRLNVVVDGRVIRQEPKGKFAPSLAGTHEARVVTQFLTSVRNNDNAALDALFPDGGYAVHAAHNTRRPHVNTLVHLLHTTKLAHMPASRIRQQAARGMNSGNVLVHMGDLEVSECAREVGGGVGGGGRFRVEKAWEGEEFKEKVREGVMKWRGKVEVEGKKGSCRVREKESANGDDEWNGDDTEWRPARPAKPAKRLRRA